MIFNLQIISLIMITFLKVIEFQNKQLYMQEY